MSTNPATTKAGGMCQGANDWCKTPAPSGQVPMMYVNMATPSNADELTACIKVKVDGQPACNLGTTIKNSNGDEPGVGGGIVSTCNLGAAKWSAGVPQVLFEGKPAICVMKPTTQNGKPPAGVPPNCSGAQLIPSQAKVLLPGP